jgi:glycosyltransferase involved in cell wall biosynthesis
MPYFSIIIPVFNKENFISYTLKSVLEQSYVDFEIIVINDGSWDESETKILSIQDEKIRYYKNENQGVAKTRNFGISVANGEFICFLDADDYWHPSFLKTFHKYTQELKNEKVFSCAIEIETRNKTINANYSFPINKDFEILDYFKASIKEAVLWTSSVCIHKSVFDEIGVFDEQLKISEDTDLWIRIGLQYKIVFINKILARYVFDNQSISRNMNYIFEDAFFKKHQTAENLNPDIKKYMDLNRFSSVIKHKVIGDLQAAISIYKEIDLKNLNWKKRILLQLPATILKLLIQFKQKLADLGLSQSVFR